MSASAITTGKKAQPKIYVLPDSYDTIQVYDPENQSWNAGPNLPTSRNDPAIAVFEDTLYVIGGAKIEYPNMQSKSSGGDLTKYAINEQYIPENYGSYDTKEPINNDTTLDREQIVFLIVAILATPIIIIICLAYYKWKRQKPSTVDFSKTMQTENPSF
jgi:hypothetical protein